MVTGDLAVDGRMNQWRRWWWRRWW